jgi:hypothetical protein
MKQYKSIAAPTVITAAKSNEIDSVIQNYASIINREAQDGWILDQITQVQTHIPAGCLASLIGAKGTYVDHNVLIFVK